MPDTKMKVVKNTVNKPCAHCGGIHDYITRMPEQGRKDCSTPVAFSNDKALMMARLLGAGEAAVIDVPHDTFVVMDDSARKLPRNETLAYSQVSEREILA